MTQMGANLVSPPPPATMAKIRLQIETHGGSKSKARPKPAELAPTLPMQGAAGAARSKRLKLALVFGGSAAVVALGLFFALRGNSKSKDKLQPLVFNSAPADLPSAPTSMRVRFDAVADARAGYLSATRKFALTGVIEGTAKDFKASIREKGGDVSFHDQGSGRFRLDFRFDHDGKFELGLEGLRLEEIGRAHV